MHNSFDAVRVPVFIISYNRLQYLRQLVCWLESAGHEHIIIVDNASEYPPLLDYLNNCPHQVERLPQNLGHLAVWKCGRFDKILHSEYYVVTDCDVLPNEDCPLDAVTHFYTLLQQFPRLAKVGFSLRIDDLPDTFAHHSEVCTWEKNFWQKKFPGAPLFKAPIDTTFALYRPGILPSRRRWWASGRTDSPYGARHMPWYEDSAHPDEETTFYRTCIKMGSSHWMTDNEDLRHENARLAYRVQSLENDLALTHLSWHAGLHLLFWTIWRACQRAGEPLQNTVYDGLTTLRYRFLNIVQRFLKYDKRHIALRQRCRSLAVKLVHSLPLACCRTLAHIPKFGVLPAARVLACETPTAWFCGTPGRQVDLVPGLNTQEPEALRQAWEYLPEKPSRRCSLHLHGHILWGHEANFSGKKVALMAHWDPQRSVDPCVQTYLEALRAAGFETVLTSADMLASSTPLPCIGTAVCRTCPGYDFTSWKVALEMLPTLREAEELLLVNDSVLAPVGDLHNVHRIMDRVECDFWGLLESRDQLPAMPSFYMLFRKRALQHAAFETFWSNVDTTTEKAVVVKRFEQSQALWFALNGLVPGAYIHWDMLPVMQGGPAYVCWRQLVERYGVPCVKRAVINGSIWWVDASGWEHFLNKRGYSVEQAREYMHRMRP